MSEPTTAVDITCSPEERDLHLTRGHDLHSVSTKAYEPSRLLYGQSPYSVEENAILIQSSQRLVATTATGCDTLGSSPFAGSASEIFNHHGTDSGNGSSMVADISGGVIPPRHALLAHQSYASPAKKRKIGGDHSFQWSGLGCHNSVLDAILEGESEISLRNDQNSTQCSLSTLARAAAAATRIRQNPDDMSSVIDENEYYEVEDADFLFGNDVQRCEAFISVIQACLQICRNNGRADAVALMASKLEKLVDTLHTP